jgi:hypothetical protein
MILALSCLLILYMKNIYDWNIKLKIIFMMKKISLGFIFNLYYLKKGYILKKK